MYYFEGGISSLVTNETRNKSVINKTPIYYEEEIIKNETVTNSEGKATEMQPTSGPFYFLTYH